jgi:arsenate reductase
MSTVTLYHNPRCSKSRQTLQLLEEKGITPEIVLYLETPPDSATIQDLAKQLGLSVHDIVRTGEDAFDSEMANWDGAKLAAAIEKQPVLLQRPIFVANGQARIGRPPESVLEII